MKVKDNNNQTGHSLLSSGLGVDVLAVDIVGNQRRDSDRLGDPVDTIAMKA
jgi:hypothetical protein